MTRWTRWLAPTALALIFIIGSPPQPAEAQEPEAPAGEGQGKGEGRPFDGYFATGCLAGLVLFIVAKSARR